MKLKTTHLKNYNPRTQERKAFKETTLDNAQKLFEGRNMIIEAFKNGDFTLFEEIQNLESDSKFDSECDSESDSESDSKKSEQKSVESIGERVKLRRQKYDELIKMITKKTRS